jgi:hypothetical protein
VIYLLLFEHQIFATLIMAKAICNKCGLAVSELRFFFTNLQIQI